MIMRIIGESFPFCTFKYTRDNVTGVLWYKHAWKICEVCEGGVGYLGAVDRLSDMTEKETVGVCPSEMDTPGLH